MKGKLSSCLTYWLAVVVLTAASGCTARQDSSGDKAAVDTEKTKAASGSSLEDRLAQEKWSGDLDGVANWDGQGSGQGVRRD